MRDLFFYFDSGSYRFIPRVYTCACERGFVKKISTRFWPFFPGPVFGGFAKSQICLPMPLFLQKSAVSSAF